MRLLVSVLLGATFLTACGGLGSSGSVPAQAQPVAKRVSSPVTSGDFTWVRTQAPGPGSAAIALCPTGWKIIGGGSAVASGDAVATHVGSGYASLQANSWVVAPAPSSSPTPVAVASCFDASAHRKQHLFIWVHSDKLNNLATVRCPASYPTLVAGFDIGFKTDYPDIANNTWNASNGSGSAYASCAARALGVRPAPAGWGVSPFASGCKGLGSGYIVIGGSDGSATEPGPPDYEFPAVASPAPPAGSYNRWWVYFNGHTVGAHASCIRV